MVKQINWFVYLARAETGYLYTGISNDVTKRIAAHNLGRGSKFSRMHKNFQLAYQSRAMSKSDALRLESEIKRWSKSQKERFIASSRD